MKTLSRKNLLIILAAIGVIGYTIYDYYLDRANDQLTALIEYEDRFAVGNHVGERAPPIELLDLEGRLVQLSDYRGKKVLVNFWATWCPPCRDEMPDMQRIYEDYGGEVIVLGVNMTKAEPVMDTVISFVQEMELTFPILLDEAGNAIDAYRIIYYPTTFLLDEAGTIRERFLGAVDYDTIKQGIDQNHFD